MKYSRFEWLTLAVGGAAIAATLLASLHARPMIEEIIAQLLLMVVLVGAVHWGRNGGFLTAIGAIVIYIAMRGPLLVGDGLTPDLLELIGIRMAAYGFVGIIGGELCGRIKYVLARMESGGNVDEDTALYNEVYIGRLLKNNLAQHLRYKQAFSIVLLTLAPALTSELKPSRRRSLLRAVANHIRNDVRLVDDVGRLDDGTFIMVLPQTPKRGAAVAGGRVRAAISELLGARDESVSVRILSAPEDLTELETFCNTTGPAEEGQAA